MLTGHVNSTPEAVLPLRLEGPSGRRVEIDAVVDTGFDGSLSLPMQTIQALSLNRLSSGRGVLADGTVLLFGIYGVTVMWEDGPRLVEANAIENVPLVGMSLLQGSEFRMQVIDGGAVSIRSMPHG